MSRQDSDDLFDSADAVFDAPQPEQNLPMTPAPQGAAPAPQRRPEIIGKRPFDVYSFSLIISFVMLTAAAILLFIDASKY